MIRSNVNQACRPIRYNDKKEVVNPSLVDLADLYESARYISERIGQKLSHFHVGLD